MKRRAARATLAAAAAVLLGYVLIWWSQPGVPADFSQQYVGAVILRDGRGADLYDSALQSQVRRQALPRSSGDLLYVYPPPVAALAVPVSLLDPRDAYRVWSAAQLLLVLAAVAVAVRAGPRSSHGGALRPAALGALAAAGYGTGVLLALGQIDGLQALGIAAAYALWRRGLRGWGAACLALTAMTGKPHLALGMAAFILGWRDRRALVGAIVGTGAAVVAWFALSGPAGTLAFVRAAAGEAGAWHLATMPSLTGLVGSWLGDGGAARAAGAAASLALLALAYALGASVRRDAGRLEPALAGAAIISVLAAPHTYAYDLALLAPAAAWSFAFAVRAGEPAPARRAGRFRAAAAVWVGVSVAAAIDAGDGAHAPPGQLTAWVLLAATLACAHACGLLPRFHRRNRGPAPRIAAPPAAEPATATGGAAR